MRFLVRNTDEGKSKTKMGNTKTIKSALISVFDKDGLAPIVKELDNNGVIIYSTGGTQAFIESLGVNVERVEDLTSYPSILGGRVKTLHPKVFGGILSRRELADDQAQIAEYDIPEIDLVIVDLYPITRYDIEVLKIVMIHLNKFLKIYYTIGNKIER